MKFNRTTKAHLKRVFTHPHNLAVISKKVAKEIIKTGGIDLRNVSVGDKRGIYAIINHTNNKISGMGSDYLSRKYYIENGIINNGIDADNFYVSDINYD